MERKFDSETKNAMLPRGKLKAVNNFLVYEKDTVQLPELFKCAYILYLMIVMKFMLWIGSATYPRLALNS